MNWKQQKLCTDVGDYELVVEQQKRDWQCEQKNESWKWMVIYHGSVTASGSVNNLDQARELAEANVPQGAKTSGGDCADCADPS